MNAFWKAWGSSPVFIAGAALVLRMVVLYIVWLGAPPQRYPNEPYGFEMGQVAKSIVEGRGFSSPLQLVDSGPTAWFTPIYPYLLASVFKLWGTYTLSSHIVIKSLNCLFSALTIFPIFGAAKRTFGTPIAVLASWLWVVLPLAWHIPVASVWDSSLSALCLTLIFYATLALSGSQKIVHWIGYGLLWAMCAMVIASILSLAPFLFIWLAWQTRRRSVQWFRPVAAGLLVLLLGMAPWTIRNYRVFHMFIPVRSNFGLELWLGNNPEASNANSFSMHPFSNSVEAEDYKQMGEIAYMRMKLRDAIAFMRSHPAETLRFRLHHIFVHWFGVTDRPDDSWTRLPVHLKIFFFLNVFFVLFSWIGVGAAWRSRNSYVAPYVIVLFVYPLLFYLTHTLARYRFPMDPILTILSVYGVAVTLFLVHPS